MRNQLSRAMSFALVASLSLASGLLSPAARAASAQVGTLTQIEGAVKIFTNPSKKLHADGGDASRALFEGEYFQVRDARLGDRVEQGNIVRTAPGAKARVVFDNGDQYNVGAGTAYRVSWDKDSNDGKAQINLMHGKLRGMITKGGPRSKLLIRTKAATMGVRGTDFFIADGGAEGETEISIIRGAVEVRPTQPKGGAKSGAKAPEVIEVKAGYSATIAVAPEAPKAETPKAETPKKIEPLEPKVELRQTTQQELAGIQRTSEIKAAPPADSQAGVSKEALESVKKLETKAIQAVINDVKATDPELYASIQSPKSLEQINQASIDKLKKSAPQAPEKRKPYRSEIDDAGAGSYDKYFKPEN